MTILSPPALRDALNNALVVGGTYEIIEDFLLEYGPRNLPEVMDLKMPTAGDAHKDNWWHTLTVTTKASATLEERLGALLHDIGKPVTVEFEREEEKIVNVRFHKHESVGAKLFNEVIKPRIDLSEDEARVVSNIIEFSGRVADYSPDVSDSAVRRFLTDAGDTWEKVLDFIRIDVTSKHAYKHERVQIQVDAFKQHALKVLAKDHEAKWRPAIDAIRVMELTGLSPGRELGAVMSHLYDLRLGSVEETESAVVNFSKRKSSE